MISQYHNYVCCTRLTRYFTHSLLFILGIFVASLISIHPSFSAALSIEEQKDVWGGDKYSSTHYSGTSPIQSAWSGTIAAVIYHDSISKNYSMLLVAKDGKAVTEPIKICKDQEGNRSIYTVGLVWDGQAFMALYPEKGSLVLKRILPDGTLSGVIKTAITLSVDNKFQAIFKDGKITFICAATNKDLKIYSLSLEGTNTAAPVSLRASANFVKAEATSKGWAVLSKLGDFNPVVYLDFFDTQGNTLHDPIQIFDASITPEAIIHWNGSTLVFTAAFKKEDGSVDLKVFTYDARGGQINDSAVYAVIPRDGYLGSVNFTEELIWTGSYYVAVWDQGTPNRGAMEDTFALALDSNGNPISDPMQINAKPLDQADHASLSIGNDQFVVFTVEKGNYNRKTVYSRIKADLQSGVVPPTATPTPTVSSLTPTPTPTQFTLPSDVQIMTVSSYIVGSDLLHIKGNEVWFEVIESAYPGTVSGKSLPTKINDQLWYPKWTNKLSDKFTLLNPALPQMDGYYYSIKIKQARGDVILVQEPNAANQYEAVLLFENSNTYGEDWYEAELRWSKSPFLPPREFPASPYLYWKGTTAGTFHDDFLMTIQGNKTEFKNPSNTPLLTISLVFSDPLPQKAVNVTPVVLRGNIKVSVVHQPRLENNYQASLAFVFYDVYVNPGEVQVMITWKDTIPEPSPTPWPTWNPVMPSPSPVSGNPKVLWVVMDGRITPKHQSGYRDFDDFRDIFSKNMGATCDAIIAGSTKITEELLCGYNVVIFGNADVALPLSETEQNVVIQYVRGGGSIFIIGQQSNAIMQDPSSIYASSISKPFGIEFSTSISGTYSKFERHILLSQVKSLNGSSGSKLLVTPPAQAIGRASSGEVILAIADDGYGRVVAFTDEMAFYSRGVLPGMDIASYSHTQFAKNLAAWLLHKENTDIPTMTPIPTATNTYTPTSTPTFDPYATATPTPNTVNLLAIYPTSLTGGDTVNSRPWEFKLDDIYSLSRFSYSFNKNGSLLIDVGPADAGIGHSNDGAVWAVVIPRKNGTVSSSLLKQPETIEHIWVRFHPKTINDLFPPETVFNNGNPTLYSAMQRIADYKFRGSWMSGKNALIPPPDVFNFDMDTNIDRRFFYIANNNLNYVSGFEGGSVPDPVPITEDKGAMFDTVWDEFDQNYAMFILRPEVNWDAMKTTYRPKAQDAKDQYEFAGVIAEMLKPLRDLHVWFMVGSSYIPIYGEPVNVNANYNAYPKIIGTIENSSNDVQYGKTNDNYGFICVYSWSNQNTPSAVDTALEQLKDTKGLIVDVRYNGGGSETLAQKVAGRFADKSYIYAYSRYRNGPNHTDLGNYNARSFSSSGAWRYAKPVICLIGRKCMSSNESFAQMMGECPNVTLMGDRTRGSSGNPKVVTLPMDMQFSVPRWIDYLPDKTPLDEHGVYPDVWFEPKAGAFEGDHDDLLQTALNRLRGNETRVFDYMLYALPVLHN